MKTKHKRLIKNIFKIIFLLYIVVLTYFLFFSERYGRIATHIEYRYNLVLFKELKRFITYREAIGLESFIINIFGNIAAFVPFAFMLPIISENNRKFLNVTIITFLFSLTVELLQLISKVGIFDVDDLSLNTLGGIFGYFIFKLANSIRKRFWLRCQYGKKKEIKIFR